MFDPSFYAPVYSFKRGSRGFPSNEIWLVRPSGRAFGHEGRLAQLVRAPALQAGGRRFESCTAHHRHFVRNPRMLVEFVGTLPVIPSIKIHKLSTGDGRTYFTKPCATSPRSR